MFYNFIMEDGHLDCLRLLWYCTTTTYLMKRLLSTAWEFMSLVTIPHQLWYHEGLRGRIKLGVPCTNEATRLLINKQEMFIKSQEDCTTKLMMLLTNVDRIWQIRILCFWQFSRLLYFEKIDGWRKHTLWCGCAPHFNVLISWRHQSVHLFWSQLTAWPAQKKKNVTFAMHQLKLLPLLPTWRSCTFVVAGRSKAWVLDFARESWLWNLTSPTQGFNSVQPFKQWNSKGHICKLDIRFLMTSGILEIAR